MPQRLPPTALDGPVDVPLCRRVGGGSRKRRDRDGRSAGVGHESAATWISLKAPLKGKCDVRIFDYVDRDVPMLLHIFEKRLRGYRAIGDARGEAPLGYCEPSEITIE